MKQIYLILLLAFGIFEANASFINPAKYYSEAACKKLGLTPVVDANGIIIQPHDDNGFFRVQEDFEPSSVEVKPEQVVNFFENARQIGSVVDDFLRFESQSKLPAIIQKRINGVVYEIGLEKLVFTPTGNTLSIYAMITTQDNKHICFAGEQIGFTGQGGIKDGTLRLVLGGDATLKFDKLKKIDLEIIEGALNFGCNGYESFDLGGKVIFDRSLIVPDDFLTGNPGAGNVQSIFRITKVRSFNDMLIEIDMQPFQMPNMPGYGFQVSKALIDVSDGKNAPNFKLPDGYDSADNGPGWQGAYVGNVEVRFPKHFKTRSGKYAGQRIVVGVQDLLIDKLGVSGFVYGESIFTTAEGDLNGWDYSIAGASIKIVKNKIKAGTLKGQMRVSVSGENQLMTYEAIIDPTRDYYNFTVETGEELSFDFLKASEVVLAPSSTVSLSLINKEFIAEANLHGELNIGSKEIGVNLEKFIFQDLNLSTKAPYMTVGLFGSGTGKDYEIGNFPVSFNSPTVQSTPDGGVIISLVANLTLDNVGVSAAGGFYMEGAFVNQNNRHFWKNKDIGIRKLKIEADFEHFAFGGTADFFKNDPVYGKGFYGKLFLSVFKAKGPDVGATAVFGRVKEKGSYWMVDAEVEMYGQTGKGLQLQLLAGCVYKKMKPAPGLNSPIKTVSGISYVPDFNINWGGRFGVGLKIGGGKKAISGAGGFEMVARNSGGLSSFGLMGVVAIAGDESQHDKAFVMDSYRRMCEGDTRPGQFSDREPSSANDGGLKADAMTLFPPRANGINGSIVLKFNFDERSFMGRLGMEVQNNQVQFAFLGAFYFSPNKWYVHLGEPPLHTRLKLKLPSIPPLFDGYIMFGDGLSTLPDPIPNIFDSNPSLAGERKTGVDNSAGIDGSGFAFGVAAELSASGGYKNILTYSAGVRVGLDMMLVNFGSGVTCYGYPGPIGLNGWLAQGQIYAVGGVDCQAFGINVLTLQLGALLKGTAPNPTYGQGKVAIKFKVLFKKFDFKMGFEVGDDCRLTQTEERVENLELFKTIYPADGSTGVDYKVEPYVQFTEEVDEKIKSEELDTEFRISVVSYTIKDNLGNLKKGDWETKKADKTKLYFDPKGEFEGNVTYIAEAKIKTEKKQGGSWVPLTVLDGVAEKAYSFKFTTRKTKKQLDAENKAREDEAKRIAKLEADRKNAQANADKKKAQEDADRLARTYNPPPPPPSLPPPTQTAPPSGYNPRSQEEVAQELANRQAEENRLYQEWIAENARREAEQAEKARAFQAELDRIKANEDLMRKAEAEYQAQLAAVANATAAEKAAIEAAAAESKRQLDEMNRQAEAKAKEVEAEMARQAEEIRKDNERKANELAEMIRNAQVAEENKRAAEAAAKAAKEAADEAARRAEEYVQHIMNQAVADVYGVTAQSKIDVENVKNDAQNQVSQIGYDTENQIRNLAYAKQAALNALVKERKRLLKEEKWYNFGKKNDIKNLYKQKAIDLQNSIRAQINQLPGDAAFRQQQIRQNAQYQMDAIVANAQNKADQIMAEAAGKSQEAMNRAKATADAIMANAKQQCTDILGGGPAVVDYSAFAALLDAQNDAYDETDDD